MADDLQPSYRHAQPIVARRNPVENASMSDGVEMFAAHDMDWLNGLLN